MEQRQHYHRLSCGVKTVRKLQFQTIADQGDQLLVLGMVDSCVSRSKIKPWGIYVPKVHIWGSKNVRFISFSEFTIE